MPTHLPFITMLLLISFASVNAVLFTPALPDIAHFFAISETIAQHTISWFLIGYALGQLLYGPIANRFGRKPALYLGISLQIISSLLCALSGTIHQFGLLIIARFLLALGSGVGLKMTFTLVNECYEPKIANQKISYLILAFAITPGLGVALGGVLNTWFGWQSCFYASTIYGFILLFLVTKLPETQKILDLDALTLKHLVHEYKAQFKNIRLITGALLMGSAGCFVYAFAAIAPFIAINTFGMNSTEYGLANILPPIGMILGSLVSARLAQKYLLTSVIRIGIIIAAIGSFVMLITILMHFPVIFSLFLPTLLVYFGICFIIANASTLAMMHVSDKAHGSSVMNFLNVGLSTILVLSLGLFSIKPLTLPSVYLALCIGMLFIFQFISIKRT